MCYGSLYIVTLLLTLKGSPSTVKISLALKLSPVASSVISYLLHGPRVGRRLKSEDGMNIIIGDDKPIKHNKTIYRKGLYKNCTVLVLYIL